MADYDSSLPVRSETDGTDERLHVKIVDGTTSPAVNQTEVDSDNNLHIEVHGDNPAGGDEILRLSELGAPNGDGDYDATNNTKPNSSGIIAHDRNATPAEAQQNVRVTGVNGTTASTVWALDVSLHDEDGEVYSSSNPLPIEFGTGVVLDVDVDGIYNVTTNADPDNTGIIAHVRNATPGDAQQTIRLTGINGTTASTVWALDVSLHDEDGEVYSSTNPLFVDFPDDADLDVNVDGIYNVSTNADPDNVGIVVHTRNATPGDTHQVIRPTGVNGTTETTVWAVDVSLHDENGNSYSESNPLPVVMEESGGVEVCDYQTSASLAKDASANLDYSVADGDLFRFRKFYCSGSGKIKVVLQIGDGAASEVFTTKFVGFNSTASPVVEFDLDGLPIKVTGTANTTTVRLVVTNLDNSAQDVYGTFIGATF